jgi:hypothetical protein
VNQVSIGMAALFALLVIWLLGGLVLRASGLLLILAGGFGLGLQPNASEALVLGIGVLLWLAGHWHYALRHHEYKCPLARHFFLRWAPPWLDPTRGWAVPVVDLDSADNERPAT